VEETMIKRMWVAVAIGIFITLILLALAYVASSAGMKTLAQVLFWQNSVLQELIPSHNIGTLENPVYEGTPLNFLAFACSIPFGFMIYGIIAYIMLSYRKRRAAQRD